MAEIIWDHVCPGVGCKRAGCVNNWGNSSPVPEEPASEYPKYLGGGYVARSLEEECHMLSNSVAQGEPERKLAFETSPDRGYTILASYVGTEQNALIELFKDGLKLREAAYPAYRIWNIHAHASEYIDAEIESAKALDEAVSNVLPAQPSPVVQTPAQFSNFCTEMDKAGVTLQFGLKAQGHMSTVERMRGEGKSWAEIGDQIGWVGSAVEQFYELETRPVVPVGETTDGWRNDTLRLRENFRENSAAIAALVAMIEDEAASISPRLCLAVHHVAMRFHSVAAKKTLKRMQKATLEQLPGAIYPHDRLQATEKEN